MMIIVSAVLFSWKPFFLMIKQNEVGEREAFGKHCFKENQEVSYCPLAVLRYEHTWSYYSHDGNLGMC